jgi:hypothetical protein
VKAGYDDRLADAVRLERVELAVEQAPAVEVDEALGLLVDEVAEARALARGKDDRLHFDVGPA